MKGAQPTLTEKIIAGAQFPRAECPVCTVSYRVLRDGTMFPHGPWSNRCRGSYNTPREKAQ